MAAVCKDIADRARRFTGECCLAADNHGVLRVAVQCRDLLRLLIVNCFALELSGNCGQEGRIAALDLERCPVVCARVAVANDNELGALLDGLLDLHQADVRGAH